MTLEADPIFTIRQFMQPPGVYYDTLYSTLTWILYTEKNKENSFLIVHL